MALIYDLESEFEEAIVEFDKAIKLNPNDPRYHNGKGIALDHLEKYQEAIGEFDKAIELDPNNPGYYHNKRLAQDKLNKHSKRF